jgi:hypothetical protein
LKQKLLHLSLFFNIYRVSGTNPILSPLPTSAPGLIEYMHPLLYPASQSLLLGRRQVDRLLTGRTTAALIFFGAGRTLNEQ